LLDRIHRGFNQQRVTRNEVNFVDDTVFSHDHREAHGPLDAHLFRQGRIHRANPVDQARRRDGYDVALRRTNGG